MEFIGDSISPLGTMSLHVTLGDEPCSKTMMTKFIVVDIPSAYNMIISRPTLNRLKAMSSTYHIVIKFPTRIDVGELRSDLKESR